MAQEDRDRTLPEEHELNIPAIPIEPQGKGRPTVYTSELAAELCAYLSEGMSLRRACSQEGMPGTSTVFRWLSLANTEEWGKDFREQYARAKEEATDAMAEEIVDISDDTSSDTVTDENGRVYPNNARIQRDRLRVDTRKWLMSKMKPKRYGDKIDVTSDGKAMPTPIITLSNVTDDIKSEG